MSISTLTETIRARLERGLLRTGLYGGSVTMVTGGLASLGGICPFCVLGLPCPICAVGAVPVLGGAAASALGVLGLRRTAGRIGATGDDCACPRVDCEC